MDFEEATDLKKRYTKIINDLGYKVMYDLDDDLEDEVYDIFCLLTRTDKSAEINKKKYIFAAIGTNSPLSLSEFKLHLPGGPKEKEFSMFRTGIKNRLSLEYDIDDVAAILLHNGYHLEKFYQFIQGKPRLVLDPDMIRVIVDEGNKKGSPLENTAMRMRMMRQMALKKI